jgi:hypothetical protein
MEQTRNPNMVPMGAGGTLARIGRMIIMVFTGGFVYPNVFVEGMDLTAIQKETEGTLYDKKDKIGSPSNTAKVAKSPGTQRVSANA